MNILKSIVDNVGDMLGTSKLSKLNATVFKPIVGLSMSRQEYEMCEGQTIFCVPDKNETNRIKSLKGDDYDRKREGEYILNMMVDNGTIFSDDRILSIADAMQTRIGEDALPWQVKHQMSPGCKKMYDAAMYRERVLGLRA